MLPGGRAVRDLAINIPAEVLESTVDAPALLRGYLDHEAAHVRWTSWDVLEDERLHGDPFLKSLLNVVEDVRVEKRMAAAFKGAGDNLARIADILFGGNRWKEHSNAHTPAQLALSWLLYRMRSKAQPSLEPGVRALGALLDAMSPGMRGCMQSVLDHFPEPRSTEEALGMASALQSAVKSSPPNFNRDPEEMKSAADEAVRAMKEAGMDGRTARNRASRASKCEESPCSSAYGYCERDAPKGVGSMADAVNEALDDGTDGEQRARAAQLDSYGMSAFVSREYAKGTGGCASPRLRDRTREEAQESASVCAGLGQRLRSLLQTQSSVRRSVKASGTRLDQRSLWRAGAADGRVFAGRSQGRTQDTEVILLVDASGSMGEDSGDFERIRMANAAMAGVLASLEQVRGVYAGAVTFALVPAREHVVVKWPRERLSAARLPWVIEHGGTDIPASMRDCANMFTPETPRKIMIVISDGDEGADDLHDAEDALAALGIEVAGVSVSVPDLKEGLRRCAYAAKPEEIPAAVFGAVQSLLVGEVR
jgi:Mg-chelatase subunit ChlD